MPTSLDRLRTVLDDRYAIERELGHGGMATVYLAHDLKHDRDVALKVLRPELAAVLGAERFLLEIRISAKLDHPHILTLIDSGESEGFVWYIYQVTWRQEGERILRGVAAPLVLVFGSSCSRHHHGLRRCDVRSRSPASLTMARTPMRGVSQPNCR